MNQPLQQPVQPATNLVSFKPLAGLVGSRDVGADSDQNDQQADATHVNDTGKGQEDAGTGIVDATEQAGISGQQADAALENLASKDTPGQAPGATTPSRQVCQQWIDAAKDGDNRELHKLFHEHPALLNYQAGGLQCTALHWAAARGHADTMQRLISWGADPCILTCTGCTALHSAAAANRVECVQVLLTVPAVLQQLQQENEDGLTAAALALKHGHKVVQGMLVQAAAATDTPAAALCSAPPAVIEQLQQQPEQHLMLGMRPGFLLSGGSVRRQVLPQAAELCSASAASSGSNDTTTLHPSQPVTVAAAQTNGVEPLGPSATAAPCGGKDQAVGKAAAATHTAGQHEAAEHRCDAATPHLHSSSSTINSSAAAAAVDKLTGRAWLDAARAADLPKMQALLAKHPQLLEYCGLGTSYALIGNSALHWAAAKNHLSCVQWLLSKGARVNEALLNQAGATALHSAAEHGQAAAAKVLALQGGGDVHFIDGLGQSAVQAAAGAGHEGLAQQLLLWDVVMQLAKLDRSCWPLQQMQRLLKLAGKSAEAAACVERQELQQLVQQVLDSLGAVATETKLSGDDK